jgi:LysM repeat protein
MRRKLLSLITIAFTILLQFSFNVTLAHAEVLSAGDLIGLVNGIRTGTYGLPALIESTALYNSSMSAAMDMAANGGCAHPGGKLERIVAAGYGAMGTFFATENMACATSLSIGDLQGYWADDAHMLPMRESQYTYVGAAAYTSGGKTYYVLHAATTVGGSGNINPNPNVNIPVATSGFNPVLMSTPDSDGSVFHIVKNGQTLYTISVIYGVTVEQIKLLNSLTSDMIYVGQKLLIKLAPTVTITPSRTATVTRPTRTPTQTLMPATPKPTRTTTPTPKPSVSSTLPKIDRQWVGLGLIVFSAIGFFGVFYSTFLKPKNKK